MLAYSLHLLVANPSVQASNMALFLNGIVVTMALIGHVPTLAEQGVKDFEFGTCQGIAIPASMPRAMVEKLATPQQTG